MPFEDVKKWSLALLELQKDLSKKKQSFDKMKTVQTPIQSLQSFGPYD